MAISFSRPDPSSPVAVGSAAFPVSRRGFDQGEVRDFLRMVAAELSRLQERERFLESELRAMQTRGMSAPGRLDEETVTTLLGEEAARVLTAARDASTQIRERAEESATRLVKDAAEDAARVRESATVEAFRIREDAAGDANSEVEMAKQQGRDMVYEAREYREKVLSELSRRRDAARSQIEQLLHGRDRLMNAFERARLASEDVIGGLTDAHDEPEFIIDLSPTTGPIPIVNPEHPSVKMFDHEVPAEPVSVQAPFSTGQMATFESLEEEAIEIEELIAVIEEVVHLVPPIDVEGVVEEVVVDVVVETVVETRLEIEIETIVEKSQVVEAPTDEMVEKPKTNVVSLFGRGRRAPEAPEVEEPAPVAELAEVIEVVEVTPVAEIVPVADQKVDDIFAKLRAQTVTETVTETAPIETVAPAEPAKSAEAAAPVKTKATKVKPVVAPVEPHRFEERDEILSPLVVLIARKLKRVLADEQNMVLEHLRAKRSSLEIDAILGTPLEQAQRYCTAISEEIMAAAGAGAKSVKQSGGSTRRVTPKAITTHVNGTITQGLVNSFREDARIAIGEAEGDKEVLTSLMRDVYRKWKTEQIDAHVDDISCSVYSKGGFLALEPGTKITWMVDPVAKCCSECEDNTLGGAVSRGDSFPTGHEHPPAHPGCRCLVCPI